MGDADYERGRADERRRVVDLLLMLAAGIREDAAKAEGQQRFSAAQSVLRGALRLVEGKGHE